MRSAVALMLLLVCAPVAGAQDARLAARLDRPTRDAVNALVDSARRARLPTAPLVDKALEGAAKGSTGPKIVSAVRSLSARLAESRHVLGNDAASGEIEAAATALDAGVAAHDLARLRAAAGKRRVTVPLAALTDLIGREVPVATAANVVISLAKAGVRDSDITMFERNVRLDIERGADPGTAATTRASGVMLRGTAHPARTR